MLVLGMILPITPLPPREGIYMQLTVLKIIMRLQDPTRNISLQTLIHLQMTFYQVHQAKQGKPPLKPLSGFQRDQSKEPPPPPPKKPFK